MSLKIQVTFDCEDAERMASFWAIALDYQLQPPPDGFDSWPEALEAHGIEVPPEGSIGAVVDPDGVGPRLLFIRVPEGKVVKNRIHLDVDAGGGDAAKLAKIAQLVEAGGTEVGRVDEEGSWWMVMQDPEGNEFCVVGRADDL
ncbi:MAG: VOC family protein [Ilumatobacteraceae bacterium]